VDEDESQAALRMIHPEAEENVGSGALAHANHVGNFQSVDDFHQSVAHRTHARELEIVGQVGRVVLLSWKINVNEYRSLLNVSHGRVVNELAEFSMVRSHIVDCQEDRLGGRMVQLTLYVDGQLSAPVRVDDLLLVRAEMDDFAIAVG